MAKFEGTFQEYHDYLGPRIRNKVNNITKPYRDTLGGICQHCKNKSELHSAHKHGHERRIIIEKVLKNYIDENGFVSGYIGEMEKEILENHRPIEDNFLFLCHSCHVKYDKTNPEPIENEIGSEPNDGSKPQSRGQLPEKESNPHIEDNPIKTTTNPEFSKLDRIERWAQHPDQINHKIISAFLSLEVNGKVPKEKLIQKCSEKGTKFFVKNFPGNFASMKTDSGNSHGKVFYEENGTVFIYPRVREEIRKYFKK